MYTRNSVVNFDRNFLTFMPSMINVSIGIYLSKSWKKIFQFPIFENFLLVKLL